MKVALLILATVAATLAEPPVPSSQYLPSNQYSAPRPFSSPSNQYGAPAQTAAFIKPNNQYIPPSNQYGAPSAPSSQYGAPGGGYGKGGYDDQSEPANYNFKYDVQDAQSGNDFGHEEARQGDDTRGKYYVLLPDGRRQVVEYTADLSGYHPKVSYEQVGGGYGGNGGYQNGGYPSNGGQGNNGGYQY